MFAFCCCLSPYGYRSLSIGVTEFRLLCGITAYGTLVLVYLVCHINVKKFVYMLPLFVLMGNDGYLCVAFS